MSIKSLFSNRTLDESTAIRAKVDDDVDGVYLQSCCVDDQKWKRKHRDELWDVRYPLCTAAIWWRQRAIPTLIGTAWRHTR